MILSPFFLDEYVPELEPLAQPDWTTIKPVLPEGDKQTRMLAIYHPLSAYVAETVSQGNRPVIISDDCCTAIGVLAGLQRTGITPTLIWFDAHGDFNTWETSPSGFLGGMPLAMIVGRGEQTLLEALEMSSIPEDSIILTDARDLDPGEREALNASAVIQLPETTALLEHSLPDAPLYIHFDTDIITPEEAPAMNYPAPGGSFSAELEQVFRHLAQTSRIAAVSVAAWNPELDGDGQSQAICMNLLDKLIE
jgi:arginase